MAEKESNLVKLYKNSPFANIGKSKDISQQNNPSIAEKDVDDFINSTKGALVPLTTTFNRIGIVGDIIIKPFEAIQKLFEKLNRYNTITIKPNKILNYPTVELGLSSNTSPYLHGETFIDRITSLEFLINRLSPNLVPKKGRSIEYDARTLYNISKIKSDIFSSMAVEPRAIPKDIEHKTGLVPDTNLYLEGVTFTPGISTIFNTSTSRNRTLYDIDKIKQTIASAKNGLITINDVNSKNVLNSDVFISQMSVGNKSNYKAVYDRSFELNPGLSAFDFSNRIGVLNQFMLYNTNNILGSDKLDISFSHYLKIASDKYINSFSMFSRSRNESLYTPKYDISNVRIGQPRIYTEIPVDKWAYNNANDEIFVKNSKYLSKILSVSSKVLTGLATNAVFTGLTSTLGLSDSGFSLINGPSIISIGSGDVPLKISSLGIQRLTGEIYYKMNSLDTKTKSITYSKSGGSIGSIGGIISGVSRAFSMVGKTFLPEDVFKSDIPSYALMISQILGGTKYTEAYAFYDTSVQYYSSKYNHVGNNSVNWYINDGGGPGITSDNSDRIKYSTKTQQIDENYKLSIKNRFLNAYNETRQNIPVLGNDHKNLYVPSTKISDTIEFGNNDLKLGGFPENKIEKSKNLFSKLQKIDNTSTGVYSDTQVPTKNLEIKYEKDFSSTPIPFLAFKDSETKEIGHKEVKKHEWKYWINSRNNTDGANTPDVHYKNFTVNTSSAGINIKGYTEKLKDSLRNRTDGKTNPKIISEYGIQDISGNVLTDTKNALDLLYASSYTDNDIIDFYFEDITSDSKGSSIVIPFRAIINSYSDNTSAKWFTQEYIGRPDTFYIYSGFERKISLGFTIAATSEEELEPMWRKLNYLQGMCYPTAYPENISMIAPIMRLTVGSVVQRVHVILNSIGFEIDANAIWDISKNEKGESHQLPTIIKASVDFTVLYDSIPISKAKRFAQNEKWMNTKITRYKEVQNDRRNTNKSDKSVVNVSESPNGMNIFT